MKKAIAILSSLALLASGCDKVQTAEEPAKDSSRHLTVNIDVNFASETRSVKTGWETGDVIYVVFDHYFTDKLNVRPGPAYYMTLTFNGVSWQSEFSDQALENFLMNQTSGKLAAVYSSAQSPEFVYIYNTPNTQPAIYVNNIGYTGFHMSSEVDYTVAEGTLTASLQMALKDNDIYFSIAGMSGNKDQYSLKCEHFAYNIFSNFGCYSDGISFYGPPKVTLRPSAYGIPIEAAQIDNSDEYYFCGYLNPEVKGVETNYVIQIIDNRGTTEDDTDDIVYTLAKTVTLNGKEAIKLPPLSDPRWDGRYLINPTKGIRNGHEWVKMADGKKWSTTNLGAPSRWDPGYYLHYWQLSLYYVLDYESWKGWTTPDYYEWKGLFESTNHTISKMYSMENGQKVFTGVYVTVKEGECKGNSLILPAAGYEEVIDGVPSIIDPTRGYYWVNWYSTGEDGDFAIELLLDPDKTNPIGFARTESGQLYIPVSENTHLLTRPIVKED